jgi:hypothetical protein
VTGRRDPSRDARLLARLKAYGACASGQSNRVLPYSRPFLQQTGLAELESNIAETDESLLGAVERLGVAAGPTLGQGGSWLTDALQATLGALNALARQLRYSSIAQDVLHLCDEVRDRAALEGINEPDRVRLLAALMVVEDATCAVEGYRSLPPFAYVAEAYLAKYGLLQALQLGFDATPARTPCSSR